MEAIKNAGHEGKIKLAIDAAASSFYENGKYVLSAENKTVGADELTEIYASRVEKYPIISIEDGHAEDDRAGFGAAGREAREAVLREVRARSGDGRRLRSDGRGRRLRAARRTSRTGDRREYVGLYRLQGDGRYAGGEAHRGVEHPCRGNSGGGGGQLHRGHHQADAREEDQRHRSETVSISYCREGR